MSSIELFWIIVAALLVAKVADLALMISLSAVRCWWGEGDDAASRKAIADRVRAANRKGGE